MLSSCEIFSHKIFGDRALLAERLRSMSSEEDLSPPRTGSYILSDISAFDYILGNKLDIIPFEEDGRNVKIYGDFLSYKTTSAITFKKLEKLFTQKTFREMFDSVVVHDGLFYPIYNIDVTSVYLSFIMEPHPSRITCMQWDAYKEMYFSLIDKMESCESSSQKYYYRKYTELDYPRQFSIHVCTTLGTLDSEFEDYLTDNVSHTILCDQKNRRLDHLNQNILNVSGQYGFFTSFLGSRDAKNNEAIGNYETDPSVWVVANYSAKLSYAIFHLTKTQETFFWDTYC